MPTPSYVVTCIRKLLVAPGVYEIAFTKPDAFAFKTGQFVLFDVALIDKPDDIQTRALSIASLPSENELLFVVKLKPGGRVSRWIDEKLTVDMDARMQGPFGLFTLRDTPNKKIFVATGAGIAPFRSQILWALQNGDTRLMHLLFGVRSEEHLFWRDTLEAPTKKYGNYKLHLCLSSPSEAWTGHRGRVQTFLPELLKETDKSDVYICGAPEMVQDVKKFVLDELKVPKAQVHAEGYI